ncbi:Metaxin-2 [Trichinella spiralis]|uniref:Metaxin-2 n=1 Tax=Trichinella spiralis TaxID=6334 RepID=A0A0V1BS44_TRISP|nr:Metaxin-2 [Trichinella spiralis]
MAEEYDTILYESTSTLISVVSRRQVEKEECTHEMREGLNGNRKHSRGWNSSHCNQNPILRYQGKFSKVMSRENVPQDGDVPCAVDSVRPELFVDVAERIDEQWDENARLFEPFGRERVLLYEHSDCLAVKALLLICNLKCKFESIRNAEDLSMNGYIPVMHVDNLLLSGFDEILLYLVRKDIVSFHNLKNVDYLFLHSLVHGILRKAELYICWVMEEVFQQVYWNSGDFGAIFGGLLLACENDASLRKKERGSRTSEMPQMVFDEVEYACECLSTKLGTNQYFGGNNPTEIDALIFGHLYTLLTTSLPNVAIGDILKKFPNLLEYCEYFEKYDTILYESTSTLISVVSRRQVEKEECTHEMREGLNGNRKHSRGWNSSHCNQNPILRYQGKFSKVMSRENVPQDGDVPCAVDSVRPELFVDVAERIDEQWDENARLFEPFGRERVLLYEHSDCLAVKALLLICNLKCKFESIRNAEDLSMNGYIPVMHVDNLLLSGFDEILLYLVRKDIVSFHNLKNVDYLFLHSLVHGILRKAELYICWVMEEVFQQVTLVRYSAAYSWPAKMTLPYEKRKEVLELLKCHRWLEKSPEEVFDEVEYACECLSTKLGTNQYFGGNNPTEIDALIFGHLYTLLTTSLPNVAIGDILKKFPNLLEYCEYFEKVYFPLLPMLNA